jgi:hypothetical protein
VGQYDRYVSVFWRRPHVASLGLSIGLLLTLAPIAGAKTIVELDGVATPPIVKFTTTPQILSLKIDARFSTDVPGELAATVRKATIFFPHGPRVNGALFPSCDPAKLRRLRGSRRACPAGSRLGGGTARGTAESFESVIETLTVDVYNGPGGRSLLFYLRGLNPVAVSGMIVAPLKRLRGNRKWEYKLTMPVPSGLQEIGPDIFASLITFSTKVGGSVQVRQGGRTVRRGFIEVLACPPGALVPVRGVFDFLGGEHAETDGFVSCGAR